MKTLEGKKKTQNGVKHGIFSALAILLQAIFLINMFTSLNQYFEWIDWATRLLSTLLVLKIYAQHQTATMKMPWIILILVFPILGVSLYLLVGLDGGTKMMSRRYREVDAKLFPMLPENREVLNELKEKEPKAGGIASYLHSYAKYPVYENTRLIYFDEAEKGLEAQLADLAKAEKFIFMEYHAIEDAQAWSRIQQVLEERVRAGVEVRVFYDDMGSIGFVNKKFAEKLEAVGIRCHVFNPVHPMMNVFLNNRDHRKITVVDGKIGYTGGYNLANEYFNITHPYGQWKDTGVRMEGDAVRSLTAAFLEMWNASIRTENDEDTGLGTYFPTYAAEGNGFIQPYADSPLDDEHVGEEVYISMANKAEKYCWFITPYLIITDEMAHALSLAAKRGVDVRIITPGIPDKKMVFLLTQSYYGTLLQAGVRIFEYKPGFLHAKSFVCDDEIATVGTINLDYRSLYLHFENGVWFYKNKAVADIFQDFKETLNYCDPINIEFCKNRNILVRGFQSILRLLAPLL